MKRSRNAFGSAAAALLLLTLACGEPSESAMPLEVTKPSAALIAVAGTSGVVHFDPNTMIVSDQEGRQIQLQGEAQTAGLNVVEVITVTDQNILEFQSHPFPSPPPECNGSTGENCAVEPGASSRTPPGQRRRIEDVFRGRLRLRFDRTRRHPSRESTPGVVAGPAAGMPSAGIVSLTSWSTPSPCYDIAVGIRELTQHFNELKSSWIHWIKGQLIGGASGTAQSGTLPTPSGTINGLEVEMAMWEQDLLVTKLALDLLAWHYKFKGCWRNNWADRSSFAFDGFSPSGSGRFGFYMKTCEPVYIEIEIDSGIWWEGWGEECDYEFFPYQRLRVEPAAGPHGNIPEVVPRRPILRRSDIRV